MKNAIFALTLTLTMALASCHPKPINNGNMPPPADTTLLPTGGIKPLPEPNQGEVQGKLVTDYLRGEIEQCSYKGAMVYRCSRNAPDAGTEVFDNKGIRIGRCYYNTGAVDAICKETIDCKCIYRMAGNIWGKPEVPWAKPK